MYLLDRYSFASLDANLVPGNRLSLDQELEISLHPRPPGERFNSGNLLVVSVCHGFRSELWA